MAKCITTGRPIDRETVIATNETRGKVNTTIASLHLATEATLEASDYIRSLKGIVSQAATGLLSINQQQTLEDEANSIVDVLSRILCGALSEREPLNVGLPELTEGAHDIAAVSLLAPDSILQSQAAIQKTHCRVTQLQDSIGIAKRELQALVDHVDVSSQNQEASRASLRDVDEALKVCWVAQRAIETNPTVAIDSFGSTPKRINELLG